MEVKLANIEHITNLTLKLTTKETRKLNKKKVEFKM